MEQLKVLEAKVASLQKEHTRLSDELILLQKAGETYQAEQERLHELRRQRDGLIQGQCEALTERSGGAIRAIVHRYSNADAFSELLRERLSGSGVRKDRIERIAEAILEADDPHRSWLGTLEDLETLANFDPDKDSTEHLPETPFLTSAGATKGDCDKLARKLSSDDWLSLSLTEIQSEPHFEYRSREGEYINFSNASSGQQATALLRTLLNQAGPPLLIDQPEEDLDNPVMQEIVEQIWAAKKRRQLIFVSHNANLVVNGDAELVAWCEYRKAGDQSGGKIAGEGAIDIPDVREAIKRIMEGGAAAFNLRREKYGF
jgi:type III restriction enzyme